MRRPWGTTSRSSLPGTAKTSLTDTAVLRKLLLWSVSVTELGVIVVGNP
jgi:hypothetical protein